jgi:hypothetical protein
MNNIKYSSNWQKIQLLSIIYLLICSLRFSSLYLRSSNFGLFEDWWVLLLADRGLIEIGLAEIGFANDFIRVLL